MKLIDKDALVAEIKRRKYQFVSQAESFRKIGKEDKESYFAALASNMNSLSCFIDTLEVKEVNLEKEIQNLWSLNQESADSLFIPMNYGGFCEIAKHFFGLGLKAKGE